MTEGENYFTLNETARLGAWGDYGSVLSNGLDLSTARQGPLRLGRTGPFVPPISFPSISGVVVVTDHAKRQLESCRCSGVGEFDRIEPEKVVFIEWEKWDPTKGIPGEQLPFNGEPEEYILHNPHDQAVAAKLGDLWIWRPEQIGTVLRSNGTVRLEGVRSSQRNVFRLRDASFTRIIVNEEGKSELEKIMGDWMTCAPVKYEIVS